MPEEYYPILLMLGAAIALGVAILGLSQLLGKQVGGLVKGTPVESGMPLLDRSHKRISIAFFLVAIDFIVFDLEAAFLYPWALVLREGGWPLFAAVLAFIFLILVGYAYVWKKGGLDLGPKSRAAARSGEPRLPGSEPHWAGARS
ncbi:MAG TPA: NADH-quinone oxidoreductase subunit A [Thermoanaerobaculia bacterium]|nr:NADH-quinone oxidoreductase subunit A [Thermoanaerobaculia bacterium]